MASQAQAPPRHPWLQPQFDHMAQQVEASLLGMWVFLATEVLFFGGLFLGYQVYRFWYPEAFAAASHHMDTALGTINTGVLIVSSFTVVLAVRAGRLGRSGAQVLMLVLTAVLGLVFLGIKAVEYDDHISHHLFPGAGFQWDGAPELARPAQLFFGLYFVMTGLHALHVLIGIGLMLVLAWAASRRWFTPQYHTPIEVGGLYWHFVDIVWIFLFPLLYLVGVHA